MTNVLAPAPPRSPEVREEDGGRNRKKGSHEAQEEREETAQLPVKQMRLLRRDIQRLLAKARDYDDVEGPALAPANRPALSTSLS